MLHLKLFVSKPSTNFLDFIRFSSIQLRLNSHYIDIKVQPLYPLYIRFTLWRVTSIYLIVMSKSLIRKHVTISDLQLHFKYGSAMVTLNHHAMAAAAAVVAIYKTQNVKWIRVPRA